jgi:SAM-dependent methyltransferase
MDVEKSDSGSADPADTGGPESQPSVQAPNSDSVPQPAEKKDARAPQSEPSVPAPRSAQEEDETFEPGSQSDLPAPSLDSAPRSAEEEEDTGEPADDGHSPDYASANYWDERYTASPEPFDWYQPWEELLKILGPLFDGTEIVLNVGCGNSMMSAEMRTTFDTVVNVDISSVVIDLMEERFDGIENLLWFVMDCTDMTFDDDLFDVCFDKGTIDALMCGDGSVEKVGLTLWEIYRVLRPGGLFLEITYGRPSSRISQFENYDIDWHLHKPIPIRNLERGGWHWIYVFEKTPRDEEPLITVPEPAEIPEEEEEVEEREKVEDDH